MASGRRGGGGFERGGRGGTRGFNSRDSHNSTRAKTANGMTTTTTTFSNRGSRTDRGQRGGTFRGGSDHSSRGNSRGRGNHMDLATVTSTTPPNTTPYDQDRYEKRLEYLKVQRPLDKERFVKEKRMNPDGPMRLSDAVKLVGICQDMCPEFERVRRIVEHDLKLPEFTTESLESGDRRNRIPDESRMVKAYQRSAAGADIELVSEIRSPSVCLKTMKYMIERIDQEDLVFLYTWLWDRTRAIRKDLRTQAIEKPEDLVAYLECFEQCARLLLICLHHMSTSPSEDYSHQQDVEQLIQTTMSLKEQYNDNRRMKMISPNEAEFFAYRLIISLYARDPKVEAEVQHLPEYLRQNRRIQIAMQIYRAAKSVIDRSRRLTEAQDNWKAFWDLVGSPSVSYLMACAVELIFQRIRHIILDTIYRVYRQKKGMQIQDWTLDSLTEALGFDAEHEAKEFCALYGFKFGTSEQGGTFLDFTSAKFQGKALEEPHRAKPQTFSWKFVESKRHERLLSAVIKGHELTGEPESDLEPEVEAEDSLFIPDDSTPKSTVTSAASGISGFPSGSTAEPPKLNPFANPFLPNGSSTGQPTNAGSSLFPQPNPFAPPTSTASPTNNPFVPQSGTPSFSGNSSFGKPSGFASPSTTPAPGTPNGLSTTSTASPATGQAVQPGLFDLSKNAIKFSPGKPIEQAPSQSRPPWSFPDLSAAATKPKEAPTNFTSPFQAFAASAASSSLAAPVQGFSSTSNGTAAQPAASEPAKPFSFTAGSGASATSVGTFPTPITPTLGPSPEEEQQRRAQEEQQRRLREEQERRAREEQERKAREDRERRAQEERDRLARQEQERRAREEQQRAAEESRRQEQIRREIEQNWNALTTNIFLDPESGLLGQFLEQQILALLPSVKEEVEQERAEKLANELYERKRQERIRSYCVRWYEMVAKKKRAASARTRRQWLRDHADQLLAMQAEETSSPVIDGQANVRPNGFKKPAAPASASRGEKRSKSAQKPKTMTRAANGVTNSRSSAPSSEGSRSVMASFATTSYKDPTAPIDRTETDWFKFRAMGIDPRRHRKRSHDSDSDEEELVENERKRFRTSTSSAPRASPRASVQPSSKDDELLARFDALKASRNKALSVSSPRISERPPAVHGAPQDTDTIIAKARALLSQSATPQHSPPNVKHEYSRSVPASEAKPAYWARASRFVPQHLYGKGGHAVREYLHQSRGSNSTGTSVELEPLDLSSPMPTQQSYIPSQQYAEYEDGGEDEDADVEEAGYDEEDERDEEDEEQNIDSGVEDEGEEGYGEDADEEYEYEYEEESMSYQQNAQILVGATEDDAIELSD